MRSVYRARSSLKIFWLVFLVFSIFFSFGALRKVSPNTKTWMTPAIGIVLVCFGTYGVTEVATASVVLTGLSISYGSLFHKKSLQSDQICCRREYEEFHDGLDGGTNVHYLELVARDAGCNSLKIPKDDFDFDDAFWEWILRFPDLDD